MRSRRSFYILLGITVVMVAAAVLSQWPSKKSAPSYGLHLPDFESKVEKVNAVTIETAEDALRLEHAEGGWVARDKGSYPADEARIRQLVLAVAGLKRVEKKTSNPERLEQLDLADVNQPGSESVQITFLNDADEQLASILVGKTHEYVQSGRSRYFIRDAGETQSWLVEGALPPVLKDVSEWLVKEVLSGVEPVDIRSVTVTHADGEVVSIHRDSGDEETDYQLDGLSEGQEIDNQYSVNAIANTFQRLALKDVLEAGSVEAGEQVATVEALTFNGVHVFADFSKVGDDYGVRLNAAYDSERDGSGERGGEDMDGERLAAELDRRWKDRLFVISQYTVDAIMARKSDLVKQGGQTATE